jgi:hypothetical protein
MQTTLRRFAISMAAGMLATGFLELPIEPVASHTGDSYGLTLLGPWGRRPVEHPFYCKPPRQRLAAKPRYQCAREGSEAELVTNMNLAELSTG